MKFHLVGAAILAGLVAIVYGQTARHGFLVVDDPAYVYENPIVAGGLTREGVVAAFTQFSAANYHPLTWLSLMVDVSLFGLRPGPMHVVNVGWHAANAILLFLVLSRMTGEPWPSLLVAALFAVHPLHVESVAWIAERKDVLSAFFGLLTLASYVAYAAKPGYFRYLLMMGLFVACLLAKQTLVTLPFALLLLDYWPLGRWRPAPAWNRSRFPAQSARRLVREKLPLLAVAAGFCLLTIQAQVAGLTVSDLGRRPLGPRIINALLAYVEYLRIEFWPTGLAIFYPHLGDGGSWTSAVVAGAALAAVTVVVALLREQAPFILVGWLWFLGTLVPMIGLVQVGEQGLADRYAYIPSWGLGVAVVWTAWRVAVAAPRGRWLFAGLGLAATITLATLAHRQVALWRRDEMLFRHSLAVTQCNFAIELFLCGALSRADRPREAEEAARRAVELAPWSEVARVTLASALLANAGPRGDARRSEAERQAREGLRLHPGSQASLGVLAEAIRSQGRVEEAEVMLRELVAAHPGSAGARQALARFLLHQGRYHEALAACPPEARDRRRPTAASEIAAQSLFRLGEFEEAEALYRALVENVPASAGLRAALVNTLRQRGKLAEAQKVVDEAAEPDRLSPILRAARADILADQGHEAAADAIYAELARLTSESPLVRAAYADFLVRQAEKRLLARDAREAADRLSRADGLGGEASRATELLGWIRAAHPSDYLRNGRDAVRLAEKVVQSAPSTALDLRAAAALDLRAAAAAEAGDFAAARKFARESLDATPAADPAREGRARRLEEYLQGRPARVEIPPPLVSSARP